MKHWRGFLREQPLNRQISLSIWLLFLGTGMVFGGVLYQFMQGVAEEQFQKDLQQDRLVSAILLQNELNRFGTETQGIVSTYEFLLRATYQSPERARSVLQAMHAKLNQPNTYFWLFDAECQLQNSFSREDWIPAIPQLCNETEQQLHADGFPKLFLLAHHLLQDQQGIPYGQVVIAQQTSEASWGLLAELLRNTSANAVLFSTSPLPEFPIPDQRSYSQTIPTSPGFHLNLIYDTTELEEFASQITLLALFAFLSMNLLLFFGVRTVLRKTVTRPTSQLLTDVQTFAQKDVLVPSRQQQSQEFDQLYAAVHEMTVSIQEARQQQLAQLEERLMLRNKLELADALGHVSHEINRYLGAIRISAEFLRLMPEQDPKDQLLQIEASVDKCAVTLRDVMQACRSGQLDRFNLKEMLQGQISVYRAQERIPVHLDYRSRQETIFYSRSLVSSVLENCIHNAAASVRKANPPQPNILLEVSDCQHQEQSFLLLRILDNGTGIDATLLESLGKQAVKTDKADGNGFGLYSLGNLLRRQGGDLYFANRPEGGAMVSVLFPLNLQVPEEPLPN